MKPTLRLGFVCAAVALLLIALGLWLRVGGGRDAIHVDPSSGRDHAAEQPGAIDAPHAAPLSKAPTQDSASVRSASRPGSRVVSIDGQVIADAIVTWIPILPEWLEKPFGWRDSEWSELVDQTASTVTDQDGRFELPNIQFDASAVGSVLWVMHPGYIAHGTLLEYPAAALVLSEKIELRESSPLSVQVLQEDGRPAVGASVLQVFDLEDRNPELGSAREQEAKQVLHRSYTTDGDGRVDLAPLPGSNWIWAEGGSLRSQPWRGPPPAEITLQLGQTFRARGLVTADPTTEIPLGTTVRSSIRTGSRVTTLDRHVVRADGTWGPAALPVLDGDEFLFRLESEAFIKEEISIEPPAGGAQVTVDFRAEPGLEIHVRVVGPDDEALKDAKAVAKWQREDSWRSTHGYTDEHGSARLGGLPHGPVYVAASCPGFVENRVDPVQLVGSRPEPVTVRLGRAGTIVGRCLHGDEPVRTFELVWWSSFEYGQSKQEISNSPDGSFRITEVPLGDVMVMAYADDHPQSEAQRVTVEAGSTAEVVIRLADPLTGRGRVMDAIRGEPVPGAEVHVLTHYRGKKIDQLGAAWPVDSQGFFEINGFNVGANPIEVSAAGYATRIVHATGKKGVPVEFGLVPLFAKQAVEIRLVTEEALDLTSFAGELLEGAHIADRQFSAEGLLRYELLDPGHYIIRVIYPGGTTYQELDFVVVPGRDARVTVKVDPRRLMAEVLPPEGSSITQNLLLLIISKSSEGETTLEYYGVPRSGLVEIRRVEGPIAISVATWESEILATTRARVDPGTSPKLRIQLGAAPVVFRVVDENHRPLPGAKVFISCPGGCGGWNTTRETDEEGLCTFTGLSIEEALVVLYRFPEGTIPGQIIDLRDRGTGPIEMVFAPDGVLKVLLLERGTPARGVDTRAMEPDADMNLPRTSSDEQGIVNFGPVGSGRWKVFVDHPGYWPLEQTVKVDSSLATIPIEVRRLGIVEFDVKTPYGNPAPGVAIDLHSDEMNEWASTWIEAGRVPAPASGLETDSDGKLRVNALPNGPFRWRATTTGGEVIEGQVVVPPHGTAVVEVTTP